MRKKFCIETQSGNQFNPRTGEITDLDITDIARALSHMCRYAGHCREFYCVAEHSVLVSRLIRAAWPDDVMARWAGLLHDATEAYICDLPTQLKVLLPRFMAIEDTLALKIADKFQIGWTDEVKRRVKWADLTALSTEARLLFSNVDHWDTIKQYAPRNDLLHLNFPQLPHSARQEFLNEFETIAKELRSINVDLSADKIANSSRS